MKISHHLVPCVLAVAMAGASGCSTAKTHIIARESGDYVVIANSPSESHAYDGAINDATDYCKTQGKRFVMVTEKSEYKGMDKTAKAALNVAGAMLDAGSKTSRRSARQSNYGTTSSYDDNKVTIVFKCK